MSTETKPLGDMTPKELYDAWNTDYSEFAVEIAAELDKRCLSAGISLVNDRFNYVFGEYKVKHGQVELCVSHIPASEQHALEAWLLQKHKTA